MTLIDAAVQFAVGTIQVIVDVANMPPLFSEQQYNFVMQEDVAVDTVIGMVSASDPEGMLL